MKGYSAGEGTGSAKTMAKQTKGTKGTTVYEGRDNEKGESQADILNKRSKQRADYDDAVSEYENKDGDLDLTEKQYKGYTKKFNSLKDAQTFSTDSINTVNTNIAALEKSKIEADKKKKADKNKKADDSGLFMKSPNKQTYDASGADERVYNVDQTKYDAWRESNKGAPDVRYLGTPKNKKHLESYLTFKKSTPKPTKRTKEIDYYYRGKKDGKGTKTLDALPKSPNKQVGPRNKKGDFVKTQNKDAAGPGPEITTTVSGKLPEGVYIGKDGELKNKEGYNYNLKGGNKKNFESIRKK